MIQQELDRYICQGIQQAKLASQSSTYIINDPTSSLRFPQFQIRSDICDHNWITSYVSPYFVRVNKPQQSPIVKIYYAVLDNLFWQSLSRYFINDLGEGEQQNIKIYNFPKSTKILSWQISGDNVFIQCIGAKLYQAIIHQKDSLFVFPLSLHSNDINFIPVRVMRNLFILKSLQKGAMYFHASGLVKDNKVYIFIGDKFAGKTTLLIRLLERRKMSLLTNDKALLFPHTRLVYGLPMSIGIRLNTFSLFPKLVRYLKNHQLSYPFQAFSQQKEGVKLIENPLEEQKIKHDFVFTFTQKELSEALESSIVSSGEIAGIFVLKRTPEPQNFKISSLSYYECEKVLTENIFSTINEHEPFWDFFYKKSDHFQHNFDKFIQENIVQEICYNDTCIEELLTLIEA